MIQRNIRSIADLVDLLEGSCFFGNEFHGVFRSLNHTELALLLTRLPRQATPSELHLTKNEQEWYSALTRFLKRMEPAGREQVMKLAEKINGC